MASEGVPDLASKLNRLFENVPKPGGGRYSNEGAAQALGELGVTVTAQHLWHLRTGRRDNPSFRLLQGIARLFGVPIGYFSDEDVERQVAEQMATLASLRDSGVRSLLMRTQGVSPENVQHLGAILEQIRRMEGLDADPAAGSD